MKPSNMVVLLLVMCSAGSAQQGAGATKKGTSVPVKLAPATPEKPIQLKPATVSGYVFALTKGGDLKPARLAKVYMFYSRAIGESADQVVEKNANSTFAADVFAKETVNGLEEARAWQADKPYLRESTICNNTLAREFDGAIVKTVEWGKDHQTQVLFGDTDEEGKFEITVPRSPQDVYSFETGVPHDFVFAPGVYLVIAYGSAGYNNAFWESEVKIEPGETVKLKMSAPTLACLKMDSQ
jgi:hypothetical protein